MREGEEKSFPETLRSEATWKAEDLTHYLRALAYNTSEKSYCLEQKKFPKRITLGRSWYEIFNEMRVATEKDSHERWAMIGVKQQRDKVFISQALVRAEKPHWGLDSHALFWMRMLKKEAKNRGIPYVVGDIHSHPAVIFRKWRGLRSVRIERNDFSAADLYCVLPNPNEDQGELLPVMFLVGSSENRVVFRSKESEVLPPYLSQDSFVKVWHKQERDSAKLNLIIAERHSLVLYKGKPNQPLIRISPKKAS